MRWINVSSEEDVDAGPGQGNTVAVRVCVWAIVTDNP
jgi:hypothetical protein